MCHSEKRLIDANVFAEHLERMARTTYPNLLPGLLEAADYARDFLPTVDAVEVVHGHWYFTEYEYFDCSICGFVYYNGCECSSEAREKLQNGDAYRYCPHCGAKMDDDGNG